MINFEQKIIKKKEIIASCAVPPIIYGAGNCGRLIAQTLIANGIKPVLFLDYNAETKESFNGIDVLHPEQIKGKITGVSKVPVILGLFNHYRSSHLPEIITYLKQLGFSNIICFENFYQAFLPKFPESSWLANPEFFQQYRKGIDDCSQLWRDEKSMNIYEAQMQHRLGADGSNLPEPDWDSVQYLPKDVPMPAAPYNFIDVGACNGDTVEAFIKQGITFRKLLMIEPDLVNFNKITKRSQFFGSSCEEFYFMPVGLGEECRRVGFNSNGTSSAISATGESTVPIVALDTIVQGFAPDYIKLDVEGAEESALRGMRKTLEQYRPTLAVCLYHRPQDLFALPLLIDSWKLNVDFYLRVSYAHCFETVMYVVPKK